jgi:subtilisin family serine protease
VRTDVGLKSCRRFEEYWVSRVSLSPLRRRSAVVTAAVTVVLTSVGLPVGVAAAGDEAPQLPVVDLPVATAVDEAAPVAPETPEPDADPTVSAVVRTPTGITVVSREAAPSQVAEVTADLRDEPGVVDVAVDTPVSLMAVNDPYHPQQWGLSDLNLMDDSIPGAADGSGVKVAVLDTGVLATHEDLAGRVRCDLGADFTVSATASSGNGCIDPHGHGTHVAGTIAAISDNGIGVTGLSAAEIIPVRVLSAEGWGSSSGIVAGIRWAVDHGASVINMSLGGPSNALFDDAVQYALAHNVVVVAAAGNNREDGNAVNYPGATPGVFSVASLDWRGVSSWFSYSGPTNLITAPGSDIVSTSITSAKYASMSGTSMATPHVAGIIARYRDGHPTATVAEIRSAVASTAIDLEAPGKDNNTGYGLIDAYELLTGQQSPARTWVTAPGEPTNFAISPRSGSLALTWGAPAYTGGAAIQGYYVNVFRGTTMETATFVTQVQTGGTARNMTVSGLTNGASYFLFLAAYHSNGDLYGNAVFNRTPVRPTAPAAPGAPAIGAPVPGNAAVTVRWSAAGANGSAITAYTVRAYRGTTLVKAITAAGTATSAAVTGLANGTAYTFTVTARNGVGTGPTSARSVAVVPKTRPGTPGIGAPSAGRAAAVARWSAPVSNGGSAITSYVVRAYRGTTLVKTVTVGPSARSVTVGGLAAGTRYAFTVTAVNAVGAGYASARSATVIPRR